MMSVKLCWQILHLSSTTLHPEWNLSVTAARRPCFTPRCNVLHPRPGRTHEGALAPAEERLMERWKTGGKILSSFLPRCHSGSYVTLLCVCLLPASCCHSAFPHSLSIPFDYSSSLKPQVSLYLPSPHPASSPWTPFTNVLAICGLIFTSYFVLCCRQRHSLG